MKQASKGREGERERERERERSRVLVGKDDDGK